eukprot:7374223-Pyramimonas_sp.AAC.1
MARTNAVNKTRVRKVAKEVKRFVRTRRQNVTKSSAWSMYKSTHWNPNVRPSTAAAGPEATRLKESFDQLSPSDLQHYEAMADNIHAARTGHREEFLHRQTVESDWAN